MRGQPHAPTELTSGKMRPTNTISIERLTDPRHNTEQTAEMKTSISTPDVQLRLYTVSCVTIPTEIPSLQNEENKFWNCVKNSVQNLLSVPKKKCSNPEACVYVHFQIAR